jgi:large subunit ribosomal protein L15
VRINDLKPAEGSTKKKKRVGRGPGSGHGKTATKGHKGQKARSGGNVKPGFEGGQMPLQRRVPKRGFHNRGRVEYTVVNLSEIERWGIAEVTPEGLVESGRIGKLLDGLKVLATGDLTRAVAVRAHAFSATAKKKIESAGGTAEVIGS